MSILIAFALAASSPPMTAGEFLSRAEPLLKQSRMILLFSSDARFLMKVVGDAADHARARFEADRAAGRLVAACLPPKGKASVNSTELLAYIRSLPARRPGEKLRRRLRRLCRPQISLPALGRADCDRCGKKQGGGDEGEGQQRHRPHDRAEPPKLVTLLQVAVHVERRNEEQQARDARQTDRNE